VGCEVWGVPIVYIESRICPPGLLPSNQSSIFARYKEDHSVSGTHVVLARASVVVPLEFFVAVGANLDWIVEPPRIPPVKFAGNLPTGRRGAHFVRIAYRGSSFIRKRPPP